MRLIYLENFTFEEKTIIIIMMIIYQKLISKIEETNFNLNDFLISKNTFILNKLKKEINSKIFKLLMNKDLFMKK